MRVLFWSGTFWPHIGGIEVLAAKFLPALRERGYQYIVVAPKFHPDLPDEESYQGIPVYRFSFQKHLTPGGIDHLVEIRRKVAKLKQAFAPELVHINGVGADDFFHLTTINAHSAPLLVTLHGEWPDQIETIVGDTLRAAQWVVGCSSAILDLGRRLAPEIATRSSIIHNALEIPALPVEPLQFDAPRIVCLGRLVSEKGMDLAILAFVKILDRFPTAKLVIAGDGPLLPELQRQAAGYGIYHAVEFLGWVKPDSVPSLINSSTLVLMPSRQESLPLVALQAASMGRPVVATRVGGMAEVVIHERTGMLVEPEDSEALAASTSFLLSNPETAQRMGEAARGQVKVRFSWERHVDGYDRLYQQLINPAAHQK